MRTAKEIIRERKKIEDKLTQAEISFNKVNYVKKSRKYKIKQMEIIIENSSHEGLQILLEKIDKLEIKIKKSKLKKISIKNKKYEEEELRESHLYNQNIKTKKYNKSLRLKKKNLNKYRKTSIENLLQKISKINTQNLELKSELKTKKEKVEKYKKRYKELSLEWKKIFPDEDDSISISVKNLDIFYGSKQSLFNISIDFPKNKVIAIIGPSGCGKTTFLKTLNRINDEIPIFKAEGKIIFQNEIDILTLKNIHDPNERITLPELRTKIGMVFQQPNPFPMSIFNNVAYGPRINGIKNKSVLKEIVDESLKRAAIYEQVKDNLSALATGLSGGQQQRLCIARAIANKPDILLMDEPTSALDPIAASKVEDLILELKKDYTIIMVTHSMQQAARISDKTAFFYQGELIEYGDTSQIFTKPNEKRTDDYIRGKFG